ncbi:hypothetical protein DYBT9275_01662 [Dyadobacter sp. CECT 9275]|uniref:Secreted protein n=1 Tax=Dyadobacter helix TaxID=2822344 RepID=A0A916N3M6_9BACT|nr:hypothetical protein [Dyadobacter sp. CECT 9275]CAG4995538.1 hypothetical protein DYBT9275_01662 [Dyadobacter sp. CECT 9275]
MTRKLQFKLSIAAFMVLCFSTFTFAQKLNSSLQKDPSQRIQIAPESVFKSFREAGMKPVNHTLTPAEKEKVNKAFAYLTPLHQRILKQHLQSISFMDNMPNTALTSPVDSVDGSKMFNITFRASLLDENISQWATWKENTCFIQETDSSYKVRVEAGKLDGIIYVLLHEATHIIDVVTNITPHQNEPNAAVKSTAFTKDIWRLMNLPSDPYINSLLEQTRFRSGKPVPISLAPDVYSRLSKTPFPSLYAMTAWSEDIAELATIYHLTTKLNQPFYIVVIKNNVELARFEPMKNVLVRQRLDQLSTFYKP